MKYHRPMGRKAKIETEMKENCRPEEFSLKSYFLAPNAENRDLVIDGLDRLLREWFRWRKEAQSHDGPFFSKSETRNTQYLRAKRKLLAETQKLSERFRRELPRHSPRYIGHMYSEYTLPAFFGHFLALMYNPNNISSESSRVGLEIENESIRQLIRMVGYPGTAQGHFTSGGTLANFEMLYRAKLLAARKRKPFTVVVPDSAHYSWLKGVRLIGGPDCFLTRIPLDPNGRMCLQSLDETLDRLSRQRVPVLAVVSVLGSTELGAFDPVDRVTDLLKTRARQGARIWHHVDAAYGGFFATLKDRKQVTGLSPDDLRALRGLRHADSITLDPHKLGYSPFASGCFLCRSRSAYRSTLLVAPYLDYRGSTDPGPFTLEGSRTAAGAIGMKLTAETLGLSGNGLGVILEKTLDGAQGLRDCLNESSRFAVLTLPASNIVSFADRGSAITLSSVNTRTLQLYDRIKRAGLRREKNPYYVSKTILGKGHQALIERHCRIWSIKKNDDDLFLIRCTIMNPFFRSIHAHNRLDAGFVRWIERL